MSAARLVRIAREIEARHPLLAYELEATARAIESTAAVNPGRRHFDESVEEAVALLESLRQELQTALSDYETAEEFAKFFTDAFVEEEELKKLLEKTPRAASTAGVWDTVKEKAKGLFKKDKPAEDDSSGTSPSYRMDDKTTDDFVEGKKDWADPSHYIEKDSKENREFFDSSKELVDRMQDLRERPSRRYVEWMLEEVDRVLAIGKKILGKPDKKPAKKPEPPKAPKKAEPKKGESIPADLVPTVDHYVDMLKEHSGDSKKTIQLLRELFSQVGPVLEPERASLASRRAFSALVRIAQARRDLRPVLLPHLARVAGRQSRITSST